MNNRDREAFDKWCEQEHFTIHFPALWQAWQAARAHYEPHLTKKAIDAAAKAIQKDSLQQVMPGAFCVLSDYDAERYAGIALRAAGFRFREEP